MIPAELAEFPCKYCGKKFSDGRSLGGHVRQLHPVIKLGSASQAAALSPDGEVAARVLDLWKAGEDPITIIAALRVHPRFVKEVLKEFDELVNEWRKFKVA
jgi:hypothetical protein